MEKKLAKAGIHVELSSQLYKSPADEGDETNATDKKEKGKKEKKEKVVEIQKVVKVAEKKAKKPTEALVVKPAVKTVADIKKPLTKKRQAKLTEQTKQK